MKSLLNTIKKTCRYFQRPIEPYLLLADRPLHQAGVVIRKCYADELRYHFGFDYCEEPNYVSMTDIINDPQPLAKKIQDRLENPLQHALVLCPNHIKGDYGVFTRQSLPLGTLIGVYTGSLSPPRFNNSDYRLAFPQHTEITEHAYSIDAKMEGGITRFLQHLPKDTRPVLDAEVLHNPKLQTAIKTARIVTANLDHQFITINQKALCCFITAREIKAGEQCGISYGWDYWTSREIQPDYFDQHGAIVDLNGFN